jgi:hypothetical protein
VENRNVSYQDAVVRVGLCRAPCHAGGGNRTHAQQAAMPQDSFLLTVFLKHDQSKTLDQINEQLKHQDYYKKFPPPGVEIVSWYVMMGIGQVVTLRVPANRLRDVNRAIEQSAWGAYRTEFYPTYDFKPVAEEQRKTQ